MQKLALALILVASLQGCGTKGPLYLPPQTSQAAAPALTLVATDNSKGGQSGGRR